MHFIGYSHVAEPVRKSDVYKSKSVVRYCRDSNRAKRITDAIVKTKYLCSFTFVQA